MNGNEMREARHNLVSRLLEGDGEAPADVRRSAYDNDGLTGAVGGLVQKVALDAAAVTDDDVAAVKAAGYTEDQIFEIVICAAVGQAGRQYDSAIQALDDATGGGR